MVLTAWLPNGAALLSCYDYTLLEVGTRPDNTLVLQGYKTPKTNLLIPHVVVFTGVVSTAIVVSANTDRPCAVNDKAPV